MFFRYLLAFAIFGYFISQKDTGHCQGVSLLWQDKVKLWYKNIVRAVVVQSKPKLLWFTNGIFGEWLYAESDQKFIQMVYSKFADTCKKNGNLNELPKLEIALQEVVEYSKQSFNATQLKKEIQEADTERKGWEVYCSVKSSLMLFYHKILKANKLCSNSKGQDFYVWQVNVLEAIADSVCNMDSENFEKYIAVDDSECLSKNAAVIQSCMKNTTDTSLKLIEHSITDFLSSFKFQFKEKECNQISDFQTCVSPVLEECAPGLKVTERLFNDVRKDAKCEV